MLMTRNDFLALKRYSNEKLTRYKRTPHVKIFLYIINRINVNTLVFVYDINDMTKETRITAELAGKVIKAFIKKGILTEIDCCEYRFHLPKENIEKIIVEMMYEYRFF